MQLCNNGPVNYRSDESFKRNFEEEGLVIEHFLETLLQTGLVYCRHGFLYLLETQCGLVNFGGQWYAGENKSGRLDRWVMKKMKVEK